MTPRFFAASLVLCFIISSNTALAQEGWREPQDTAEAVTNPDRYAWRLFVALNWPADVAQKNADSSRTFGDTKGGPVVWETWRSANNNAPDTAYPIDGSDPGPWLGKETPPEKPVAGFDRGSLQQQALLRALKESNEPMPAFEEDIAQALEDEQFVNETRLNEATYEFVRANKLYNADEQIKLFSSGVTSINFPLAAKEIKAQWREISETDKPRYHWVKSDNGKIYGLTALHITTKDLPKWFWATFEHVDNKLPEAQGGRKFNEGWNLPSRDHFACAEPPYDCNRAPPGLGLEGTKWENYRLRGTQVDFVDSRGENTHLANSEPELGFQNTSSCITCHARSTISSKERLSIFKCIGQGGAQGYLGAPSPDWFFNKTDNRLRFTQLDFVWSLFRAGRSNSGPVAPQNEPDCS